MIKTLKEIHTVMCALLECGRS